MTLASPLRKVASKLMAKFGGNVTIRIVTPGAYNTSTGAITESVADTGIKGVLEDVSVREVNELVQASDKKLIIAALDLNGTTPDTSDRVVISAIVHQIIEVRTIEQNNEPITYELILRA
jgi:hypothetical protein